MARIALLVTCAILLLGAVHVVKAGTRRDAVVRDDFLALRADCHGTNAKGNGPLAKNLAKVPPDLTRIKERAIGEFNDKAVFDWILGLSTPSFHGTRDKPI